MVVIPAETASWPLLWLPHGVTVDEAERHPTARRSHETATVIVDERPACTGSAELGASMVRALLGSRS